MVILKDISNMKKLLFMTFLGLTWGCKEGLIKDDDELSIQRTPYTGNQLRTDGYYYREADDYIAVYFLYRDGTILYGSSFLSVRRQEKENEYTTAEWQSLVKKYKYRWGVFAIEGNIMQFERWYPSEPPLEAYVDEGQILNDTTFAIARSYRVVDGQETEVREWEETYHFKEFSPKPDSTNGFVR